jgi:RNA polymerase sigma factor (TIGR02999 family)
MMERAPEGVTALLRAWGGGEQAALERLIPLVYGELHRMAGRCLRGENHAPTLQPTALVNEAYLRLADVTRMRWQDRAHFFAVSARLMRRILVEAARARGRRKRGGDVVRVGLDESLDAMPARDTELIALDDALHALARFDARKAQVVELRFFGGLSVEEAAEVLKVSPQTVLRDWRLARAWLTEQLAC